MITHSSILAWGIPWTEELVGLQSTVHVQYRIGYDSVTDTHSPSASTVLCTQTKSGEKNDDARVWQEGEMESSSLRV